MAAEAEGQGLGEITMERAAGTRTRALRSDPVRRGAPGA